MINHFVNLVLWDEIFAGDGQNDRYFADTQSMVLASRIFGSRSVPVLTGSIMTAALIDDAEAIIVHSGRNEVPLDNLQQQFITAPPRLQDFEGFAEEIVRAKPEASRIYLGISSPKQNHLARCISAIRNDVEIYCIGAVIDDYLSGRTVPQYVRRFRVEWLYRALHTPRRALTKFRQTFSGMTKIALSSRKRSMFRSLSKKFCADRSQLGLD